MNIFCIEYRFVHHDDQNEMPFVIEWIVNTTVIWINDDVQDILRRQNLICSRERNVNEVHDPPRVTYLEEDQGIGVVCVSKNLS